MGSLLVLLLGVATGFLAAEHSWWAFGPATLGTFLSGGLDAGRT